MGLLADDETRQGRIKAHRAFDALWKNGLLSRKEAYVWLREEMGWAVQPHIGDMGIAECRRVVDLVHAREKASAC